MKLINITLLPFLLARGISSERAFQSDEIKDSFAHQLQKKNITSIYTPDFSALCTDAKLGPLQDATPQCVSGSDQSFDHNCKSQVSGKTVRQRNSCRAGFFCVQVDGAGNVDDHGTTIKCVQSYANGTLVAGDSGGGPSGPYCNKKWPGNAKFFGRITKKSGDGDVGVEFQMGSASSPYIIIGGNN